MTFVSDDFNRPDAADLGPGWVSHNGILAIAGGMVYPTGSPNYTWCYSSSTTVMVGGDMELTVTFGPSNSTLDHVLIYVGANAAGECLFAYFYQNNAYFFTQGAWASYSLVYGPVSLTQAEGDSITLRRNGTLYEIFKNGVDTGIGYATAAIPIDASHNQVGFAIYSDNGTAHRKINSVSAKDCAVDAALSGSGTLSATVEVVAPPSGFAPTDLSGCTVWLDATQLSSLTTQWPDLSGNDNHGAVIGTPVPTIENNSPYGLPVVRFKANEGRVRGSGMYPAATPNSSFTVMFVGRQWGPTVGRIFSNPYPPYNFLVGTHASGRNSCFDAGWINSGTGWTTPPTPWTTWGFVYHGSPNLGTFFVDGVDSGSNSGGGAHDHRWNLSGYSDTGTEETCDVEVAELVIYDRDLTTTERQQVEEYLHDKWFAPPPVPVAAALSGSGTLSATVEVASAWGPDERTIIDSTPGNLYAGDYTIGTRFTANADGRITHIRAFLGSGTHTFSFWDAATQTKLTTSVVETFSGAADHRQVALTTPVSVVAGTSYVATASVDGATYGYTTPIPTSLTSNITLAADMMYGVGSDVFPTNTGSGYHNHVDVIYQEYLGTAPPSIPVSADLSGSGTLSASVTESYSSAPALGGSGSLSATVHKWASPADTPGLGLWLDASALTGLSPGDPVTAWPDSSSAARHATAVDGNKPIYHSTSLNGHPAVYFGGASRRVSIPGLGTALTGKTQYTLFYVAQVATFGYSVAATAPTNTIWRWLLEYEPSGGFYWGHSNGNFWQFTTCLTANTPHALTFHHTLSGSHFYVNGTENTSYYTNGSGLGPTVDNVDGDVLLGAYYEGSYPVDGVIAELIWYDHALTTAERLQVEGYLNEKYFGAAPSTPVSVGFSGGGALAAAAAESYSRSISLGGGGTLSATVMKVAPVAASLAGSGTLSATVMKVAPVSGALGGGGTLSATVEVVSASMPVSAGLSGSGALSAAAIRRHPMSAASSGSGSLSATVKAVVPQAASLAGTGTLSATLSPIRTVAVGLAGTGMLLATFVPAGTAPSSPGTWTPYPTLPAPRYGGGWTASPVAVLDPPQRGWLGSPLTTIPGRATGTGQLTVTITARRTGHVLLAGDGQLAASVLKREYRPALLAGDGQPSASYSQIQQSAPQFFGLGTLYGVPISELAFPDFAGGGEFICYIDGLSAIVCPGYSLGVNFTGDGTLAGDYDAILRLNMTFAGQGLLSATFSPKLVASLTGGGALSASVLQAYLRTAALLASGSLSATDFAKYLRSIGFTAPGDLTALFLQLLSPPAGGDGTISAQVMQRYSLGGGPTTPPVVSNFDFHEGSGNTAASLAGGYTLTSAIPANVKWDGQAITDGQFAGPIGPAGVSDTWTVVYNIRRIANYFSTNGFGGPANEKWLPLVDFAGRLGLFSNIYPPYVQVFATGNPMVLNQDHIVTYVSTSAGFTIYLDGAVVLEDPHSLPWDLSSSCNFLSDSSWATGGVPGYRLDNLRFWNVALSASEVAGLALSPRPPVSLSGGGTLTAIAGNQMSPAFSGGGTLSGTMLLQYSRPTGLSGYGALLANLWALYQRSTAHGGTGTLSVTPSQLYTLATTPLSGGGTLSGSTVAWYYPAAALSGGGSLAVSGVFASYQQAASLSGGGTLSATATKVPIPAITSITTAPFHVGDTITLTGTDFSTTTGMTVGGVAVTEGLIVNDTTMTIVIPAGVALGAQNVVVIAASGASAPYSITIVAPPATITTVSPSTGHRETAVTITGTNFIGVTSVTIGGQAVTNLSVVNTTTITCSPPGLANATYDVVVATSGNGTATKTSGFTYSFTPISETNTARTNQARPAGTSGCWVTLIGAGGGAGTGHGAAFTACGGGGGGGGAGTISRSFIAVASLGSTYSVVRPTGSTAAGAATSFTSGSVSLSANGGGKGGNGGSGTAGTAGAAGTTTVSGATVTSINGAAGAAGAAPTAAGPAATNQTTACPGGGGGGGRTGGGGVFAGGKGGNSSFATGGSGGSSGGGTGGTGGNASPLPGNPGAGGGGGGSANGTGGTGGPAGDYGAGGGGGGGGNSTGPAGAGGDGYSLIEWV